jgi:hypothetical protein
MKFELLPNEILIECFEYLNILDLYHSFNQLNYRFSHLIQNISSYLNFQHIRKNIFNQFCSEILSNSEIKQQIYSLHLSNENTCNQIETFLSLVSLNELSHLHSLTLTQIEENNIALLKSTLPSLSSLHSFHLISPETDEDEIISALPISNLRRLSLLSLPSLLTHIQQPTIITHLTFYSCSLEQLLYQLFKYVPRLKYLNIGCISKYYRSTKYDKTTEKIKAVHLKQLVIGKLTYEFDDFKIFVKQIPNLKCLTISADDNIDMMSANRWEKLITFSLPHLKTFQFKFSYNVRHADPTFLKMLLLFQCDFWHKKHQWKTEIMRDNDSLSIYTVPYLSNTFKLDRYVKKVGNNVLDNSTVFAKVTNLTLNYKQITKECSYRFSNVISLKLIHSDENFKPIRNVEYLKNIIKLSNLKHFDISMCSQVILSGELLIILKQSPQLSSMTINPVDLTSIFNDDELCQYLNKMVKKLDLHETEYCSLSDSDEVNKFCEVFSNVEQLIFISDAPAYSLCLLYRLSKLSTVHIYLSEKDISINSNFNMAFTNALRELNFLFRFKGINTDIAELSIWIDKNTN